MKFVLITFQLPLMFIIMGALIAFTFFVYLLFVASILTVALAAVYVTYQII